MLTPCLGQNGFHGQIWREQNASVPEEIENHLLRNGKLSSAKNQRHTNLEDGRVGINEVCTINHSGRRQRWCGVKHPAEDRIWFRGQSRPSCCEQATTHIQGDHLSLAHCYRVELFRIRLNRWELFMMTFRATLLTSSNHSNSEKLIYRITRGRQFKFYCHRYHKSSKQLDVNTNIVKWCLSHVCVQIIRPL